MNSSPLDELRDAFEAERETASALCLEVERLRADLELAETTIRALRGDLGECLQSFGQHAVGNHQLMAIENARAALLATAGVSGTPESRERVRRWLRGLGALP